MKPIIFNKANFAKISKHFEVRNDAAGKPELMLYGQIGESWDGKGTEAKDFVDLVNAIPRGTAFNLRINSEGGNTWDALAMYHCLLARSQDVTAIIDGVALSAASFLMCAAGRTVSPPATMSMMHEPWTYVAGNATSLRETADVLDQNREIIAGIYAKKSGKSLADCKSAMAKETWMTATEAKEFGLVDEITDGEPIQNSTDYDLSHFRQVPTALLQKPRAPQSAKQTTGTKMDKLKILALLRKRGVTIADDASDEAIESALNTIVIQSAAQVATSASSGSTTAAAATATTDVRILALEQRAENERRQRLTSSVQSYVDRGSIASADIGFYVDQAMVNETRTLEVLNRLPAPVVDRPLGVEVTSPDIRNMASEIVPPWNNGTEAWKNSMPSGSQITAFARNRCRVLNANRAKLSGWAMNANTTNNIDAGLQRQVILNEPIVEFRRRLTPLSVFCTRFNNVVLEGSDKVDVPYYPLEAAASTDWAADTGYTFGDTTTNAKEITINKRKFQGVQLTSSQIRRQPFLNMQQLVTMKVGKLASDVVADVMSTVTIAHYPTTAAQAFALATIDLTTCLTAQANADIAKWPDIGRSLLLDSTAAAVLASDTRLMFLNAGVAGAVTKGEIPEVAGFAFHRVPSFPTNSEKLIGITCFMSGLLIGTSPIMPAPDVLARLTSYDAIIDDQTGMSFEYRRWGLAQSDSSYETVEANYGYQVGQAAAIQRLVTT